MNKKVFEEYSVKKAVLALGIPCMLSMLVTVIYNMADTAFVGQTGDPNMVAAVSLAMPIFSLFIALGSAFGVGASSIIARALGVKDFKKVKEISSFALYASIIASVAFMAVMYIFMDNICRGLGASDATFQLTKDYLSVLSAGTIAVVVQNTLANTVRAEGAAKEATIGLVMGTVVNIILDPIMISGWGWGVVGAAIATIIGCTCSCIYYIAYFLKSKKTCLSIAPKNCRLTAANFGGVISVGMPAAMNSILMSISTILLNNVLASHGDLYVTGMGIATKTNMMVALLQLGIAMGVQPLIGYCYSSRKWLRMKKSINFACVCTVVIGVILTVMYELFAGNVVTIFMPDNKEVLEITERFVRTLAISGPIMGIGMVIQSAFQAWGKPKQAFTLSICRQGFAFIAVLFIGNAIAGVAGVAFSQPIADIICMILSVILQTAFIKNHLQKEMPILHDETPEELANRSQSELEHGI